MKRTIIGAVISLCLGFSSLISADQAVVKIDQVELETQKLHCEVAQLRHELKRLEKKSATSQRCFRFLPASPPKSCASPNLIPAWNMGCKKNCEDIDKGDTETGFSENSRYFNDFAKMWSSPKNMLLLAALGSTVTTSPFLGLRSAFDASDLIINLPTMNEDLRFLKEHVKIEKKLDCYGIKLPDRPIIVLGGKIEGIMFAQENWNNGPSTTDIDLSNARLDVLVEVSKGVHAFMAMNMDTAAFNLLNNSNLAIQLQGAGSKVYNSEVYVSRAFVTVGDLNCVPVYFTIGQMFVPFGRFASNMVTSPLTVQLARTNERAILLGLYKDGLYGSVYAFRGETRVRASGVNQGGTNWGYEKSWTGGSFNVGAGYIGNLADATGLLVTGNSVGFFGFALNSSTEFLVHNVPAYDVHGEFSFGKLNLFAEYIWADREFDVTNLSFNGRGAKPSASNFELGYNFKIADCPASIAAGYGTTTEAVALGIPKSSFITAFNVSIWKNTIESLEFRHDNNYDSSDFAGGNGSIPFVAFSKGGSRNTYTAQIGVYF